MYKHNSRISAWALCCVGALVAANLVFVNVHALGDLRKQSPHTASIITELPMDHVSHPTWCYDRDPAFVFSQGQSLFLSDVAGRITQRAEAAYKISMIFCSEDGQTIYTVSPKIDRLTIYDAWMRQQAEYSLSPPPLFNQGPRSFMSADGSAFVLPSHPTIISGKDVLSKKTVIQIDKANAYWTRNVLFLPDIEKNSYRLRRVADSADLGLLKLTSDRFIQGIFACGESYFVLYWVDERQRQMLVRIDDKRLQGEETTKETNKKYDDVGVVDQFNGACTISFVHDVRGIERVKSALILKDKTQELVDLRKLGFLGNWLSASKNRHLILGMRFPDARLDNPPTGSSPVRIVVARIER